MDLRLNTACPGTAVVESGRRWKDVKTNDQFGPWFVVGVGPGPQGLTFAFEHQSWDAQLIRDARPNDEVRWWI